MKALDFVKKYKLSPKYGAKWIQQLNGTVEPRFDHTAFCADMKEQFELKLLAEIPWQYDAESNADALEYRHYIAAESKLIDLWEGVENKSGGVFPERLWRYFKKNIVIPIRNNYFPVFQKAEESANSMSFVQLFNKLHDLIEQHSAAKFSTFGKIKASEEPYTGLGGHIIYPLDNVFDSIHQPGKLHNAIENIADEFIWEIAMLYFAVYSKRYTKAKKAKEKRDYIAEQEEMEKFRSFWKAEQEKREKAWNQIIKLCIYDALPAYEFFSLSADATIQNAKHAYRNFMKAHHTDLPGNNGNTAKLAEANKHYLTLKRYLNFN